VRPSLPVIQIKLARERDGDPYLKISKEHFGRLFLFFVKLVIVVVVVVTYPRRVNRFFFFVGIIFVEIIFVGIIFVG
jgi:hypothetical protein